MSQRAIISHSIDLLLTGGLSIIVLAILWLASVSGPSRLVFENFLILTVLINGTHFLASYRLLYSSKQFALSYPWASIFVPAGLVLYGAVALGLHIVDSTITLPIDALLATASLYLALHYTGQAWGMMSSFAYLDGFRFQPNEKNILRLCLRVMTAWHVLWALRALWTPGIQLAPYVTSLAGVMNVLGVFSLVAGVICLWLVGRREGRWISARVVAPYVALHVWYAFLYVFPQSIFWVQIFHALQYLPFPLRVELNRALANGSSPGTTHMLGVALPYALTLVGSSLVIFGGIPWAAEGAGGGARSVWLVISAIINIHHYFIDGCIWRISNPVVSRELFAHTGLVKAQ